jgi:hypothetical protein
MGTKAQPTNNASSLRPNLLRSGVDGRVISAQVRANPGYFSRSPHRASVMPIMTPPIILFLNDLQPSPYLGITRFAKHGRYRPNYRQTSCWRHLYIV